MYATIIDNLHLATKFRYIENSFCINDNKMLSNQLSESGLNFPLIRAYDIGIYVNI